MSSLSLSLKPLSVTANVVGLQTDDAGHVGQNSSVQVAHVVGLQTDAVVVTASLLHLSSAECKDELLSAKLSANILCPKVFVT